MAMREVKAPDKGGKAGSRQMVIEVLCFDLEVIIKVSVFVKNYLI